jgi:hypothetical protein
MRARCEKLRIEQDGCTCWDRAPARTGRPRCRGCTRLHTVSDTEHGIKLADWRFAKKRVGGIMHIGEGSRGLSARTVEEHDGPGVGGLEELGVRGRLHGVLRPTPSGGRCHHLQPRPSPSSCGGLCRLTPLQEAVPSVQGQGWRRVVPGGALGGGCHRPRLGCDCKALRDSGEWRESERRVVDSIPRGKARAWCTCFDVAHPSSS